MEAKQKQEIIFTVALMGFFGTLFVIASKYPKQPRELPEMVSGMAMLLLAIRMYRLIVNPSAAKVAKTNWLTIGKVFGILVSFVALLYFIGIFPAAFVMLYGLGLVLKAKSKVRLALVSVGIVLVYWLIFSVGAGVNLPSGMLIKLITG